MPVYVLSIMGNPLPQWLHMNQGPPSISGTLHGTLNTWLYTLPSTHLTPQFTWRHLDDQITYCIAAQLIAHDLYSVTHLEHLTDSLRSLPSALPQLPISLRFTPMIDKAIDQGEKTHQHQSMITNSIIRPAHQPPIRLDQSPDIVFDNLLHHSD